MYMLLRKLTAKMYFMDRMILYFVFPRGNFFFCLEHKIINY